MANCELNNKKEGISNRTFCFGVRIVKMVLALPKNIASDAIGRQIIRSGTSIGANVSEAQGAISKKEFIYQMNIAKREAKETLFWLKMILETKLMNEKQLASLLDECDQLVSILITIIKNSQKNIHNS